MGALPTGFAAANKAVLNGTTPLPSLEVPSANSTIWSPPASLSKISFALFAAAKPVGSAPMGDKVSVQTLAITYTKIYGLPLCRRGRHVIAWYGDMDMASHAWRLLGLGPIDANIRIGPPVPLDEFPDRKALARYAEDKVRKDVVELLRGTSA
jgi:hypothetical protein